MLVFFVKKLLVFQAKRQNFPKGRGYTHKAPSSWMEPFETGTDPTNSVKKASSRDGDDLNSADEEFSEREEEADARKKASSSDGKDETGKEESGAERPRSNGEAEEDSHVESEENAAQERRRTVARRR